MHIEGSVAAVTGAGSGIGRALATAFAAAGASVVAGDIHEEGLADTIAAIRGAGGSAVAVTADVSTSDGITALLEAAEREFGAVDVFVANAGITGAPGIGDDEDDWDRIIDVNLRAHIRAAKLLVPGWLARGRGHFVAVASAAGLLDAARRRGLLGHQARRGGVRRVAVDHIRRQGVGVSCVCPMGVDTPLLNDMVTSDDPAARLAGAAVRSAGEVVSPQRVAELIVTPSAPSGSCAAASGGAGHVPARRARTTSAGSPGCGATSRPSKPDLPLPRERAWARTRRRPIAYVGARSRASVRR